MKTHRLPKLGVQNSLPLPTAAYVARPFYSLFQRDAMTKRWKRITETAYLDEKLAIRVYLARIAEAPLSRAIRLVKVQSDKAGKFSGVTYNPIRDSPLRERVSK